jgi:hypothetical protein
MYGLHMINMNQNSVHLATFSAELQCKIPVKHDQ